MCGKEFPILKFLKKIHFFKFKRFPMTSVGKVLKYFFKCVYCEPDLVIKLLKMHV